jgi:hypothetical protein
VHKSAEPGSAIPVIARHDSPHPSRSWPLALLAACAIALTAVPTMIRVDAVATTTRILVGLASASRPGSPSPEAAWSVALPPHARSSVQADLSAVAPVSGPLLERLAGMVSFDDRVAQCAPPAVSCSSSGSGLDGRWGIHLDAQTTAFTYPSNRFLVYHEIGHAAWGLLLGSADRRAFEAAVNRALRGRPCVNDQGRPCAVLPEIFADEFARHVGGFRVSMSYYCTPPLLDAAAFGAIVGAHEQPVLRPHQEYLWRPAYVRGKVVLIRIRADAANVREDRGIAPER